MWETGSLPASPSLIPDQSLCTSPDTDLDDLGNLLHVPKHSPPSPFPQPHFLPSPVSPPVLSRAPSHHSWYMELRMLSLGGGSMKPNSRMLSTWGGRWLEVVGGG